MSLKETYEAWAVEVMFDDHSSMLFPNDLENGALFDTEGQADEQADLIRQKLYWDHAKDARPVRVRVTVEALEE